MNRHWLTGIMVLGALALAGCKSTGKLDPQVMRMYRDGRYADAMGQLEPALEGKPNNSTTLDQLRYASCALRAGEYEQARDVLIDATSRMENFKPDGEFKALADKESSKDYLGDPYEQTAAFFYLGLLDYRAGEYDKALAGFKTALLADAGSRDDRYRADTPLVLVMMGKAYQKLGEPQRAAEAFQDAKNVIQFKAVYRAAHLALEGAGQALRYRAADKDCDLLKLARDVYLQELSIAAMDALEARAALEQAAENSIDQIHFYAKNPKQSPDKGRWKGLNDKKKQKLHDAVLDLKARSLMRLAQVNNQAETAQAQAAINAIDQIAEPNNNLTVIAGLGWGPYKYQAGEHGSLAKIGRANYPERACKLYVNDGLLDLGQKLEDLYYQASTRGGREMDAVLKGKAVFKDVALVAGVGTLLAATQIDYHDHPEAALAVAVVGAGLIAASALTHPEADIRYWEFLPNELHLASGQVAPGAHRVEVKFLDQAGGLLASETKIWDNLEVKPGREELLIVFSGPRAAPRSVEPVVAVQENRKGKK